MNATQTNGPSGVKPKGGLFGFPIYAEHTPPPCQECGGPCKLSNVANDGEPPQWISLSRICPKCVALIRYREAQAKRDAAAEARQAALAETWAKFGPMGEINEENIYRGVEFAKLPNPHTAREILAWTPRQAKGLIIFGETAQGKTFMIYALAKKLILEHGVVPLLVTGPGLRNQISEAARSEDSTKRGALLARLTNAPVLMIDDLGQAARSDAAEEALLEIVEGRTSRQRPIIATTNFVGESFASRFLKPETGAAVIRRLSAYATTIRAAKI